MSFFKKLKNAIQKIRGTNEVGSTALEDILLEADFGVDLAEQISRELDGNADINTYLHNKLSSILSPLIVDFELIIEKSLINTKPIIIFMIGVNGCGKTTTIAKLAHLLKARGKSVDIAACDTFRVAAVDQLSFWAEKVGCRIFRTENARDPASLVFDAIKSTESDVLIVDTAGRLPNNPNLMGELSKMYRVASKIDSTAPHMNIIIIDATIGQNVIEHVKAFNDVHPITGLILTKMDGNAKGGSIVRIANELHTKILGVGTGESIADFQGFSIDSFLKGLVE
ncbi:MAG: signal recognition particle-docking protein FtsY [Holosporales bacterium]|jgi:fused signal recognition particle receptor|nr:signal recognition particle-docking protein FtsY [Holosporales bacterium]